MLICRVDVKVSVSPSGFVKSCISYFEDVLFGVYEFIIVNNSQ